MPIQLAAGNYWRIKKIMIDPISYDVSVLVNLWTDAAAFTANAAPVGVKSVTFPNGTFTQAAINNINSSVEQKLVLQPQFSGGVIV